jgi:hypothetical protein
MEGLLHLCGLAAAVSIAYVGLDQLHWDDKRFETSLADARKKIGESLLRYGLQVGPVNPKDSCDLFRFATRQRLFVLCHVGKVKVEKGILSRFVHHVCLLRHVPLLEYFNSRNDRVVARWMALISILSLLYVSALATWNFDSILIFNCPQAILPPNTCSFGWSISAQSTVPYLYGISAAILVSVCAMGYFSQRLQDIKNHCDKLDKSVNTAADKMRIGIRRLLPNDLPPAVAAPDPPRAADPALPPRIG